MNKTELNLVQKTIGYDFKNEGLLKQAFIRKSFAKENQLKHDNELLEFLGDSIVGTIVTEIMINVFTNSIWNGMQIIGERFSSLFDEERFTNRRNDIVCRTYLSGRIRTLGFDKYLLMGKGDEKLHINEIVKVQCDLFEAIVGATTIDCNYNYTVLRKLVSNMLDIDSIAKEWFRIDNKDYITYLDDYCVTENLPKPIYNILEKNDQYQVVINWVNNYTDNQEEYASPFTKLEIFSKNIAAKQLYSKLTEEPHFLWMDKGSLQEKLLGLFPDPNEPITRLNEFIQKEKLSSPKYHYYELRDENGDLGWICECTIDEFDGLGISEKKTSKKEAKKDATYRLMIAMFMYAGNHGKYTKKK